MILNEDGTMHCFGTTTRFTDRISDELPQLCATADQLGLRL
eukprot:CAMPEP_0206321750 /NCGR_PEP_ID=MMETSP0106_2-20121207/19051_1 /ASSEMBLY_ACC=CAM_ASM_000206 /TAXON_ID=81532 /ORGANISM="Acanthoeca-like sp., Strain 10tr" /LENGTH=40 /DNA_ID= /DNA_START= /DNA_END= /DNA_ORIENTATION=